MVMDSQPRGVSTCSAETSCPIIPVRLGTYPTRLNIGKIRTEENILSSFAPHDISVMLALRNEMPTRVLLKMPWELHRPGRAYEVIISTARTIPEVNPRLLLVCGPAAKDIDARIGIAALGRQQGAILS